MYANRKIFHWIFCAAEKQRSPLQYPCRGAIIHRLVDEDEDTGTVTKITKSMQLRITG